MDVEYLELKGLSSSKNVALQMLKLCDFIEGK